MSRGASSFLLFLAVVVVVGFLFWLERTSSSVGTNVAPVLEEEQAEVTVLDPAELAANPEGAVGKTGVLSSVTVGQRLGRAAFAVRLDGETLYPVLLSSDLIQRGTEVYGQDRVTLHGHVFTLNDSIRAEWVNQEAVDAANAGTIPASPSFIMADSLAFN